MPAPNGRRITQGDVARMAGVSQTVVSFVLNNREENLARVPQATRDRVLEVIRQTGYVANPHARRLRDMDNRILGVYTYEPLFPYDRGDFYHPILAGIEEQAQREDRDLLLLTSGRVAGRPGGLAGGATRLRVADACILLGQQIPREDIEYLTDTHFPFVSVGRRDDVDNPLSFVGVDYAGVVAELAQRARSMGHRTLAYVGYGRQQGSESFADRLRGFETGAGRGGVRIEPGPDDASTLAKVLASGATVAFAEQQEQVEQLTRAASAAEVAIPQQLSLVSLAGFQRPNQYFTGFTFPGHQIGRRAVRLLCDPAEVDNGLLTCDLVDGATLGVSALRREAGHSS